MRTRVSIPDDLFTQAEDLARKMGKLRRQLYCDALREYVARHNARRITQAMNRVCNRIGDQTDRFVTAAARGTLERTAFDR